MEDEKYAADRRQKDRVRRKNWLKEPGNKQKQQQYRATRQLDPSFAESKRGKERIRYWRKKGGRRGMARAVYEQYRQLTGWPQVVPPTGLLVALDAETAGLEGGVAMVQLLERQPKAGPSGMSVFSFLADPVLDLTDAQVRSQISAAGVDDRAYGAAMEVREQLLSTRRSEEFGTDAGPPSQHAGPAPFDKYPEMFGDIDLSDMGPEMFGDIDPSDMGPEMFGDIDLSGMGPEMFGDIDLSDMGPEMFGDIDLSGMGPEMFRDIDLSDMAEIVEPMPYGAWARETPVPAGLPLPEATNPVAPFIEHLPGVADPTLAGEPAGLSQRMEGPSVTVPQLFPDASSYGPVGRQPNVAYPQGDTTAFQQPNRQPFQQSSAYPPGHGAHQEDRLGHHARW